MFGLDDIDQLEREHRRRRTDLEGATTKNIETPAVGDGTGLAEALLGLDGFRVLAVHETPGRW